MASLQSRIVYLLMKNRHLFRFQWKQEAWDWDTDVQAFRDLCEAGAKKTPVAEGVVVQPATIGEMYAEWLLPAERAPFNPRRDPIIFYTAGGGYVSGTCADHRGLVSKIVKGSGVGVLLFDHRLAPEHPYPAALDDSLSAYDWLLNLGAKPGRIVMVGESAGGGLCLATLLALRDRGKPLPAAAVMMSAFADLTLSGESYRTRRKYCLSPVGMAEVCSKHYAGDHDRKLPYISPLFGELHGLPPLFISVGDYDTLLDDSLRVAKKAQEAGVEVTLRVGEGMVHVYPLLAPMFPEATQALDEICGFIRKHLEAR